MGLMIQGSFFVYFLFIAGSYNKREYCRKKEFNMRLEREEQHEATICEDRH